MPTTGRLAQAAQSASKNVLYNNGTTAVTVPMNGAVTIKNHNVSGNASDATVRYNGINEGGVYTWTPTLTSFPIVNGTGGVTASGSYSIVGSTLHFTIAIVCTGTATIANGAAGTARLSFPTGPFPLNYGSCPLIHRSTNVSMGNGLVYTSGNLYPPAFSAVGDQVIISGTYHIA